MKISVVIPIYNTLDLLKKNIAHNIPLLGDSEIIIVDDCSDVPVSEGINPQSKVTILRNDKNMGFAPTVNKGIAYAKGSFIFLLNSDVILLKPLPKNILDLFEDETLFAISFAQIERDGKVVGQNKIDFKEGFIQHSKSNLNSKVNAWPEGGASIIRKDYFEKLGGFNVIYAPFYWEDVDLGYRAHGMGWTTRYYDSYVVEHHHETTISAFNSKNTISSIAFRNQLMFMWMNITDPSLFKDHLTYLPKIILSRFPIYLFSFFRACIQLPHIIATRRSWKLTRKVQDKEILDIFKIIQ